MTDVGNRGAYVAEGVIWEIFMPSPQLCCKPKTALKTGV